MESIDMQERINIQVESLNGKDLVIRHGEARKLLDEIEPRNSSFNGTISVVQEWICKRMTSGGVVNGFVRSKELEDGIAYIPETVRWCQCKLCVNRDAMTLTLIVDERDERKRTVITGNMYLSSEIQNWRINSDEDELWSPEELGKFVKMNRSAFVDKMEAMKLTNELMHFNAKVSSDMSRSQEENGNRSDCFTQIVESNIPKSFKLRIPIIRGIPKEDIEVETFADINGRSVRFSLISPAAQELIDEIRDRVIDEQIAQIKALSPEIENHLAILEV